MEVGRNSPVEDHSQGKEQRCNVARSRGVWQCRNDHLSKRAGENEELNME
jgi:hypothetical protein